MPNGGTLRIGTVRADNEVLITVSDTGPGMSAKTVKQATAPFFSTKDRGSGLGLSLCARILEGHGAEFDILSSEGAGTTFTIRLQIPREELNA
jgi:two-component system, NtrC family, sensor kinase